MPNGSLPDISLDVQMKDGRPYLGNWSRRQSPMRWIDDLKRKPMYMNLKIEEVNEGNFCELWILNVCQNN